MRRLVAVLVLALPGIAAGQSNCAHEPTRTILISGAVGMVAMTAIDLIADPNHRIDPGERVIHAWGSTWGAVLGSAVGSIVLHSRCPASLDRSPFEGITNCPLAARRGAALGAVSDGLVAFLAAPIVVGPVVALSGKRSNFDHMVGLTTAAGAAFGLPYGAYLGYHYCAQHR